MDTNSFLAGMLVQESDNRDQRRVDAAFEQSNPTAGKRFLAFLLPLLFVVGFIACFIYFVGQMNHQTLHPGHVVATTAGHRAQPRTSVSRPPQSSLATASPQ